MHPVVWVVWAGAAVVAAGMTSNPAYLAVIAAAAWLVHAVHGRGSAFRRFVLAAAVALALRTLLVFALLLTPGGSLGLGNVLSSALEGARLATILVVVGAFNSVADPFGVLRLAPGRLYEAALAAALALQIAPRTLAAVGRVREAQRMRGIEVRGIRSLAALAVPVLATGLEEAVLLAESMDARGHGRGRRTRMRADRLAASGVLLTAASVAVAAGFVAASAAGVGDLTPSMLPPRAPDVAVPLALGAALLAAPALVRGGSR
jgi:energy-coupling factor transport system permease protein